MCSEREVLVFIDGTFQSLMLYNYMLQFTLLACTGSGRVGSAVYMYAVVSVFHETAKRCCNAARGVVHRSIHSTLVLRPRLHVHASQLTVYSFPVRCLKKTGPLNMT